MKANRHVVQYLEEISKEGVGQWTSSMVNRGGNSYNMGSSASYLASAEEIAKLRHMENNQNQQTVLGSVGVDSPYRHLYLKFKKMKEDNELNEIYHGEAASSQTMGNLKETISSLEGAAKTSYNSIKSNVEGTSDILQSSEAPELGNTPKEEHIATSILGDASIQGSKPEPLRKIQMETSITGELHNVTFCSEEYGSHNDRHTAIYKRYVQNPRMFDLKEHRDLNYITKAQQATFVATLVGALIPAWALSTKRRYRAMNTKVWVGLCTAHLCVIGVNTFFNHKFRSFLNSMDEKYFSKMDLAQIAKC